MSMSNYEVQVMLGCLECEYADQDKLKEMKKFHDLEDWINCSNVKGSCTFPFKRNMQKNEDGTITCLEASKGDEPKYATEDDTCSECGLDIHSVRIVKQLWRR